MKTIIMKPAIKIILTILNIVVIILAIATVGYFWGYKTLEADLLQKGFNIAISQITQSAQTTGQVQIGKDLILIVKPNAEPVVPAK